MTTKKIFLFITLLTLLILPATAQTPSWAAKASKAVFTVKTFSEDDTMIASASGFFVSADGDAVSSYAPFRGAHRAIVIDAQGKEWQVTEIQGADETFDVVKFHVATKKAPTLPIATDIAHNDSKVYLLPYGMKKKPVTVETTIINSETFETSYPYYTLSVTTTEMDNSTPVLNENGEVIGLLQAANDNKQETGYAVSARYAADLKLNGLSMNDPVLRSIVIAKAVPGTLNDAILTLYMAGATMKESEYSNYLDRFISNYPSAVEGYAYRARFAVGKKQFENADNDFKQCIRQAENKGDAHFQYAQLIYQHNVYQTDNHYEPWSFDKALEESREAYKADAQSVYLKQQAEIHYAKKDYEEAFNCYMQLTKSDLRAADIFFSASMCKAQQGDTLQQLALLDSAVAMYTKPYLKEVAPYLLYRAQARHNARQYRPAVADYNDYAQLMVADLNAEFYYLREQSEVSGRLYQQALNDINKAVEMDPESLLYLEEKASLLIRVNMHKEAIETARLIISKNNQAPEGYLFLGAAQCLSGNKTEGLVNLNKAKEMGDSQAQTFIDKYVK